MGDFPELSKTVRIVIIKKSLENMEDPSSCRPMCLLSIVGKLFKRLIVHGFSSEVAEKRNLFENQHGFKKAHFMMDALNTVCDTARPEMNNTIKTRELCALVTLDLQNVNTARADWGAIMEELKRNLLKIIRTKLFDE